ncbi:hypothetical protein C8R44DRAFT_793801, partial [Mycena epipterygia]
CLYHHPSWLLSLLWRIYLRYPYIASGTAWPFLLFGTLFASMYFLHLLLG